MIGTLKRSHLVQAGGKSWHERVDKRIHMVVSHNWGWVSVVWCLALHSEVSSFIDHYFQGVCTGAGGMLFFNVTATSALLLGHSL